MAVRGSSAGRSKKGSRLEVEEESSAISSTGAGGALKVLHAIGKFKRVRQKEAEFPEEEEDEDSSARPSTGKPKGWRQSRLEENSEDSFDFGEDGSEPRARTAPSRRMLARASSAPGMGYERTTVSVSRMRSWMGAQKGELDAYWKNERQVDKGVFPGSDADSLRGLLIHRHRTCTCGWRLAIDKRGMHRVGGSDFYTALRGLGYPGDAKAAYKELSGQRGVVTLADLDTEAARNLSEFYRTFREQVGRISELVAGSDCQRVDKATFFKRCKKVQTSESGEALDLKAVFKALQTVVGFITGADCDWLEHYCERGKRRHKASDDAAKEEERAARAEKAGKQAVKDFKVLLQHKYGSVTAAWHRALDPGGRGDISRQDLTGFCESMGSKISVKDLWEGLGGEYSVKLEDLEPAVVKALENFTRACEARFGSVAAAFRQLEAERKPLLSQEEFTRWCKEIDRSPGTHRTLFSYLDEGNVGYITLDVIDAAAADKVFGEAKLEKARAQFSEMESRNDKKPEQPTLLQREVLRSQGSRRPANDSAKVNLQSLLAHLERRFGSVIRAWQAVFDVKGEGKVTKPNFVRACAVAGYPGNVDLVMSDLGKTKESSTIRYKDLDETAAEEIRSFKELAVDKYVTVHDALGKVSSSKSKQNPKVNMDEFSKLCSRLKIDKEKHNRLFALLDAPGRKALSAKSLEWLNESHSSEDKALSKQLTDLAEKRKGKWNGKLAEMRPPSRADSLDKQGFKLEEGRERRKANSENEKGREELLRTLSSPQFAGITRGWQLALDTEREGELGIEDFTSGMQRIGLMKVNPEDEDHEKVEKLFDFLDEDGLASITLSNLDRGVTSNALAEFRQRCEIRFGSLKQAFQEFDPKGTGQCTSKDFRHMCHVANCSDRVHRLLQLLDPKDEGVVKFEDIDKEIAESAKDICQSNEQIKKRNRRVRERQRGAHMYKEMPAIGVPTGPEVRAEERKMQPATNIIKDLRLQLCHRYGTVPRAWRKKLDPEGDSKIGFEAFEAACKACKLSGDFQAAWKLLAGNAAGITLEELEPAVKADMKELRERLVESYGSMENALDLADADGTFTFKFSGFKALCDYCQFRRNERRLFDYLDKTGNGEVALGAVFPSAAENVKNKREKDEEDKRLWQEAQEKRYENSRRRVAGLPPLEDIQEFETGEEEEEEEEDEEELGRLRG